MPASAAQLGPDRGAPQLLDRSARLARRRALVRSMDEEVIPVLRVHDAARAVDWYRRLGFEPIGHYVKLIGPGV